MPRATVQFSDISSPLNEFKLLGVLGFWGWTKISLHEGIILPRRRGAITLRDLHEALALLRERHPPAAEVAELKIFGQMSLETIADVLDTPPGKVKRLWNLAQAFLKRELRGD